MDKNFIYYEMLEALARPGCPICALVARHSREELDATFYESVNDPEIRSRLRSSFGFCSRHAAVAAEIGSPLGIALIYEDIIHALDQKLSRAARSGRSTKAASCPFCESEHRNEERLIQAMAAFLADEEMQEAFKNSEGLCSPHLLRLITASSLAARRYLVENERVRLSVLRAELKELIRKNDYRFSDEPIGSEGNSWLRALQKVAGNFLEAEGKVRPD